MTTHINVALSVTVEDEGEAAQVAEQLGRQAVGFGLAGHIASVSVSSFELDEES
jgi:hypothetical protein